MTLPQLAKYIQNEGLSRIPNQILRDACGYCRLRKSVVEKIRRRVGEHGIGMGSELARNQNGSILLYDARPGSLFDIARHILEKQPIFDRELVHMQGVCRLISNQSPDLRQPNKLGIKVAG